MADRNAPQTAPTGMCPYCGLIVPLDRPTYLTATHPVEGIETRRECEGSGQHPRCAESDRRTLWNGKPNPHHELTEASSADVEMAYEVYLCAVADYRNGIALWRLAKEVSA